MGTLASGRVLFALLTISSEDGDNRFISLKATAQTAVHSRREPPETPLSCSDA